MPAPSGPSRSRDHSQARRYERIQVDLPCRLFIPSRTKGAGRDAFDFEAYASSRNLSLGGVYLASSFLLRPGLALNVELGLPGGPLAIEGRVAHVLGEGEGELEPGMGIEFGAMDADGRETLLRFFTPDAYRELYSRMLAELPHLKKELEISDVSLIVNLWEELKVMESGGPRLTASGAPPPEPRRRGRPGAVRTA